MGLTKELSNDICFQMSSFVVYHGRVAVLQTLLSCIIIMYNK